jgi:hypothetical protein
MSPAGTPYWGNKAVTASLAEQGPDDARARALSRFGVFPRAIAQRRIDRIGRRVVCLIGAQLDHAAANEDTSVSIRCTTQTPHLWPLSTKGRPVRRQVTTPSPKRAGSLRVLTGEAAGYSPGYRVTYPIPNPGLRR